jgi:putative SOS response-associated peptidase YedK
MCYDIEEGHRRLILEAIRIGGPIDQVNEMIDRYNEFYKPTFPIDPLEWKSYHLSGFTHPEFDVVHAANSTIEMEPMRWGLIPYWCKEQEKALQLWNSTINARSESMFEKPSFRKPATKGRGIIIVNSFFEHHHAKGKTYPFNVRKKDGGAIVLGVLWDEWADRTSGETLKTFSIVTVKGNDLLSKIHNNPKLNEPRMPLVLEGENIQKWLDLSKEKNDLLEKVCLPFSDEELHAYSVGRLRGKNAVGPGPEAIEEVKYEELEIEL